MTPRLTRRINSSVFPANIGPHMTSSLLIFLHEVPSSEDAVKLDPMLAKVLGCSLLSIHKNQNILHHISTFSKNLDSLDSRTSCGSHILQENHLGTFRNIGSTLDQTLSAMFFGLFTDIQGIVMICGHGNCT